MRNLKKLFAVLLTVAMLASIMVPALAAEGFKYETEAEQLYDLGLFKGVSDTEYKPELETVLTRETGLVLVIRAMGMEEEVQAMTAEEIAAQLAKVEDLDTIYDWAHPYVAYALKTGLTNGIGGAAAGMVKYAGQLELTGKEFVNFMLKGLGYNMDGKWDEVATEAATAGLPVALSVNYGANNAAINRDVAVGLIDGFMVAKNSAGVTMAQALVDAGAVDADKMAEYGYFTPTVAPTEAPEELEIVATVDNLVQVNLTFNTDLDKESAEDKDNYDIDKVKIADAALQEDGRTVVLTFEVADAQDQQDVIDITVDGVKDADKVALDEYTVEDVEFIDTTIPTAVDATVVGSDTFKVTFSEPMKSLSEDGKLKKADFSVNGGKSYVKEVRLQKNGTEALVELYNDLKEGEVTLLVKSGSEDFAGFGVIAKTFTLDVVKDEEAPTVIGYEKASRSEVTLIWSEDIELIGSNPDPEDYYHTNGKNHVRPHDPGNDKPAIKIDGNKMTLYFGDDDLMHAGTSYVYVLKEAVRDLWNNKNAQQMIEIEIEVDVTAPEVDKIDVKTEKKIEITFTENLDTDSAKKKANYTILKDGDEVEDIIDKVTADGKKVTITFEENLNGDYAVAIENVEDKAGNEIVSTTVEFTVGDKTAPEADDFTATLYKANAEGQMIKVNFKDVMATEGKYSVVDAEKYVLVDATNNNSELAKLEDIDGVEFEVVDDGKAVEIYIPSYADLDDTDDVDEGEDYFNLANENSEGVVTTVRVDLKIARVADAAGNKLDAMTAIVDVDMSNTININKAEATARDTIEVTFDEELADFEVEDIIIKAGSKTWDDSDIAGVDTKLNDGKTVAVFTLDDADSNLLGYDAKHNTNPVIVSVVENPKSENRYGKPLDNTASTTVVDKIKPALFDKADVDFADDRDNEEEEVRFIKDYFRLSAKDALVDVNGKEVTFEVDENGSVQDEVYYFTASLYFSEDIKAISDNLTSLMGSDFIIELDGDTLVNGKDYFVTIEGAYEEAYELVIWFKADQIKDGNKITGYELEGDLEISLVKSPQYIVDKSGNDNVLDSFDTIEFDNMTFEAKPE